MNVPHLVEPVFGGSKYSCRCRGPPLNKGMRAWVFQVFWRPLNLSGRLFRKRPKHEQPACRACVSAFTCDRQSRWRRTLPDGQHLAWLNSRCTSWPQHKQISKKEAFVMLVVWFDTTRKRRRINGVREGFSEWGFRSTLSSMFPVESSMYIYVSAAVRELVNLNRVTRRKQF